MVSGGGRSDRRVIIWDLNMLTCIRSLEPLPGPAVALIVSSQTVRHLLLLQRI